MKVSVVVTSYNYGQYLKDTINSVMNQSFKDWEMIVIDDCSSDNSVEIISQIANLDDRIKVIKNRKNQGLCACIKIGIAAASGQWIAFLESDDLWRDDYLAKKIEIADKYPDCGLIYNDVEFFGENADDARKKFLPLIEKNRAGNYPRSMFYDFGHENPVLTMSSAMIKRELLTGGGIDFNTPIDKLLDWYLYVQIARKTDFYFFNEALTFWRQHFGSYIGCEKRVKYKFANISAYLLVLYREPWNLKLIIFILVSIVLMCIKRLKFYLG